MIGTVILLIGAFVLILFLGILLFPMIAESFIEGVEIIEEFKRKRGKRKL